LGLVPRKLNGQRIDLGLIASKGLQTVVSVI
jgi:hypothetical protein